MYCFVFVSLTTSNVFCVCATFCPLFCARPKTVLMNFVGRSANSTATRRLLAQRVHLVQNGRRVGRVPNRGYIGAVRSRTFDQSDSLSSSRAQPRIRRHLATTPTARHAEPLSDASLNFGFSTDITMASLTPPQPPPSWQHTVEDIERLTTELLAKNKQASDDIVQLPDDKLDFDTVSTISLYSLPVRRVSDRASVFRCLWVDSLSNVAHTVVGLTLFPVATLDRSHLPVPRPSSTSSLSRSDSIKTSQRTRRSAMPLRNPRTAYASLRTKSRCVRICTKPR